MSDGKVTLTPNTILQRLPNLHLQIDSSNQVRVLLGGKSIPCGPQALAVLEVFAHPTSLGEALKIFQARGAQHWMDVTSTIVTLCPGGCAARPATGPIRHCSRCGGFWQRADSRRHAERSKTDGKLPGWHRGGCPPRGRGGGYRHGDGDFGHRRRPGGAIRVKLSGF